ncbi:LacI family transcriptional regulator [Xylanimonas allomyrinae]|uniref:LacI family transcriptional regulator n=1 Tax=Xylanimonas allomyrinae TaxID=2509459 RepID=A0A4P6EQY1_9MICO|nr:LacI family DNA-binding transcriptional regulator [Xylanimonas allomyrinae]QAY62727.1 LacI family transcriptional regulator [Xylanimonas allomyrinae]
MATMDDVARLAGVSVSTVSHVLNSTRAVAPDTRSRVEDAMARLAYRRNDVARSLAQRKTRTVGVAISALTNPYFGTLVSAVNEELGSRGYAVILGDTGDEPGHEATVVERMLDQRVAGLLLAPSARAGEGTVPQVLAHGVPLVLVDRHTDADCDQVVPLNREPVEDLVHHLADLGHTRIAAVCGMAGLDTTTERLDGYRAVVAARGLDEDPALVLPGHSRADAAEDAVLHAFARPDRPSAVVVLNNAMTIGTLRALDRLGLAVPGDVALVCYDDFEWADLFRPRLTAVRQDLTTMARRAVRLLLGRVAGDDHPPVLERITPSLQHRESCGCRQAAERDARVPARP